MWREKTAVFFCLSVPGIVHFDCISVISAISLVSAANLSSAEPAVVIFGLRLKGQDHLPAQ